MKYRLLSIFFFFFIVAVSAQGTWTFVNNFTNDYNAGVMLLLTDGSVITTTEDQFGNLQYTWDKLTPDSTGSYANGNWTTISPMFDNRLYFSAQVLQNGKVYVAGGEYGSGGGAAEVYDPLADIWTQVPGIPFEDSLFDANSQLLPDGRVLQNIVKSVSSGSGQTNLIYNPDSNLFSPGPNCLGSADESMWLKLPDSSILFEAYANIQTERFIPALNQWFPDRDVVQSLYDNYFAETGPGFMLPNGKAFFIGSNGNTGIYTPGHGTAGGHWVAGPHLPDGYGMPDAPGSMMPNGKILCAVGPVLTSNNPNLDYQPPTAFFEYDYTTDSFTQVMGPDSVDTLSGVPVFVTTMLNLPDGTIMFAVSGANQYFIYAPDGAPVASGKPTVNNVVRNESDSEGCQYMVTGTLFNGISQGSAYGDDWQMATNYPIVRLVANGRTYYARTTHWNRTGVQTGSLPDTAYFTLPVSMPAGNYSLLLSANGISSDSFNFAYSACATAITAISSVPMHMQAIPNPTHDATDLKFTTNAGGNYTLQLTDLYGRTLLTQAGRAVSGTNTQALQFSGVASGVYVVTLQMDEQRYVTKIVVQ